MGWWWGGRATKLLLPSVKTNGLNLCQHFPDLGALQEFADTSRKMMFSYPVRAVCLFQSLHKFVAFCIE